MVSVGKGRGITEMMSTFDSLTSIQYRLDFGISCPFPSYRFAELSHRSGNFGVLGMSTPSFFYGS